MVSDHKLPSHASVRVMIDSSPVLKSFLAGSFSGTCSVLLFQPLDLIKTRLQSSVVKGQHPVAIWTIVSSVFRQDNIRGFWRGLTPSILRCVPGVGVYFSSLHWLRTNFGSSNPSSIELLSFGVFARCIAGVTLSPFTVIKTRYESDVYKYNSITSAARAIYQGEGIRGLYCGLSATLLRDAPFSGLYLWFYTRIKAHVPEGAVQENYMPLVYFGSGIVAGSMASLVTQPFDVVKTHLQLYPEKFKGYIVIIKHIYQHHGLVGFVRGIVPRTLRRTLMAAMAWTVYEQVMKKTGLKD
ncbi:solute carrier family 25 member 38-B-like isoform X1 [Lingula anatina]|uniref:Mitochondrial glycine transporter n=1 Tax=Lingula anatina TaxID=7574 RepID=A0A1S3I2D8_LINAN|nr:solute carrier family 25 member 38-B-like isoform X1 [Lingula anatina]|eukprot:XP_013392430.1 solute carrier family 25 member 38-B-like isoform X1 [Lingula anatina]